MSLLHNFWSLYMDAALWLCVGLLLASMIKAWLPSQFMQRHLGKAGKGAVIKGALIGAPLPLCSCGVLPVAVSLRRAGASRGATVSFLVATPETGVDSVMVSYALLGPFLAIIRPIAAICSAIVAGLLAGTQDVMGKKTTVSSHESVKSCCGSEKPAVISEPVKSCCGSEKTAVISEPVKSCCGSEKTAVISEPVKSCCGSEKPAVISEPVKSCCGSEKTAVISEPVKSCCGSNKSRPSSSHSLMSQWRGGLVYAFGDILDGITLWLLFGLAFAAVVTTYVEPSFLAQWGSGPLAMLVVIAVGIPMYICATASTPIAAALLLAGMSPGTVLVFMMAGPATNIAAVGLVKRELGLRALVGYLAGVSMVAIAFGMAVDYYVVAYGVDIRAQLQQSEHFLPHELFVVAAVILAFLMLKPLRQRVFAYLTRN